MVNERFCDRNIITIVRKAGPISDPNFNVNTNVEQNEWEREDRKLWMLDHLWNNKEADYPGNDRSKWVTMVLRKEREREREKERELNSKNKTVSNW